MAAVPGDANLNGTVDQNDFDLVIGNFGSAGGWTQGDFNYNGVIDQNDFDLVLGNFGSSFDPAPVYHASALASVLYRSRAHSRSWLPV